jgi:hypothetical protein
MRKLILTTALLATGLALAAPAAQATPPTGNRADHRLDRRGDRIEHRLDRRGDRIDRRRGGAAD